MEHNDARSASGFTLIETVIATGLFVTLVAGLAELFVLTARFTGNSNRRGQAVMAAQAKIEDLRARHFGYDAEGNPITDPVLAPSPPDTLHGDVTGYYEALDSDAEVIPAGDAPTGTFARRWAIAPLDAITPDALVIEVCVFRQPATGVPLTAAEVCVSTIRSRQP
jgi:type II secretory pathway pseudopilin PulG